MNRVLSFDLSLVATGFALGDGGRVVQHGLIPGKHDEVRRLRHNRDRVCEKIEAVKPDLVVFEDLAQSRNMSFAKEIAGMTYMIRAELDADDVPYVVVSPTSLKKFVVGTAGSAKNKVTKELVIKEIYKRFSVDVSDNNQADAVGLCFIGMALLGDWPPQIKPQEEVLAGLREKNKSVLSRLDRTVESIW